MSRFYGSLCSVIIIIGNLDFNDVLRLIYSLREVLTWNNHSRSHRRFLPSGCSIVNERLVSDGGRVEQRVRGRHRRTDDH